jgi:alpha-L-fucosidase
VPYDGKLTAADGKGTWWEGSTRRISTSSGTSPVRVSTTRTHSSRWEWGNGVTPPDQAYCEKFYNRTMDLIEQISARPHLLRRHRAPALAGERRGPEDRGAFLQPEQPVARRRRRALRQDSRARPARVHGVGHRARPQQRDRARSRGRPTPASEAGTTTEAVFDRDRYKSAKTVVHTLIDVVSKNGNLLLSVPLKGDGTPDEKAIAIVEGIADWMQVNRRRSTARARGRCSAKDRASGRDRVFEMTAIRAAGEVCRRRGKPVSESGQPKLVANQ